MMEGVNTSESVQSSAGRSQEPAPSDRLSRPNDAPALPLHAPDWTVVASARLCILPEAWDGWASILDRPYNAFAYGMSALLFSSIWNICGMIVYCKPAGWVVLAPAITYGTCQLPLCLLMWRYGPMVSRTKIYRALAFITCTSHAWVNLRLLFWRGDYVPFGSHLLFTVFIAVGLWAATFAGALGCWAEDHPSEPYRSCKRPLWAATIRSLRVIDAFTDLLLIRFMLEKAQAPCYWFGVERACLRWRVMAACAGASAALDLVISISLAAFGSAFERCDAQQRRWLMRAHVVAFSCEVSILTVTLVKLFSDFQEPAANMSASQRRNAVTLTLGSFAVTVATFCLTMLGMKAVLTVVTRVSAQLRGRLSRASARSGGSVHPEPVEAAASPDVHK